MLAADKKRPLSVQEAEWIDNDSKIAQGCGYTISGLSDLLVSLSELMDEEQLDEHYKDNLCRKGVMAVAYGIKELTSMLDDRQSSIQDTISGITMAERKGRLEHIRKMFPNCPSANEIVDRELSIISSEAK